MPLNCLSGRIGSLRIEVHNRSPYSLRDSPSQSDLIESLQTRPLKLAPLHCLPPLFGLKGIEVRSLKGFTKTNAGLVHVRS